MISIINEFKSFAMRGNVVDLAVGVIIGGAFGAIVNSLVVDVIMPVFGALTGNINFSELAFQVGHITIAYGKFLQATLSFLIIAWALFLVIKFMNTLRRKEEEKPSQEKTVPEEVKLLTEIRDLLKK